MQSKKLKIILTGGGTGGHVFPILAIVSELKRLSEKEIDFLWVGSKTGPEKDIAGKYGIKFRSVYTGKIRRYFSWRNILDIFRNPVGIVQSFFIIKSFRPDVIFSKGGYVSIPAVLAGWFCKIPSLIHESDTVPGLANRFLSKYSRKIAISFEESKGYFSSQKCVLTGNPIRPEILEGSKERGFRYFGLEYGRPVILVIGGSQGSQKINEIIIEALPKLQEKYQVIHLSGEKNLQAISHKAQNLKYYKLYPFLPANKIADAQEAADLIVSRAGANALAELATLGKPSILVPLPTAASDHQRKNAQVFEKAEAAWVIEEKDLTAEALVKEINWLFSHAERMDKMAGNVLKLARPNAAKIIAEEILKLIKK